MRKICYFALAGRENNVLSFASTTDLTLLCAHWGAGFVGVHAEVDLDRAEVRDYEFTLVHTGEQTPDYDKWRYWCTIEPRKHKYMNGGAGGKVTLPRSHLYVKRECHTHLTLKGGQVGSDSICTLFPS